MKEIFERATFPSNVSYWGTSDALGMWIWVIQDCRAYVCSGCQSENVTAGKMKNQDIRHGPVPGSKSQWTRASLFQEGPQGKKKHCGRKASSLGCCEHCFTLFLECPALLCNYLTLGSAEWPSGKDVLTIIWYTVILCIFLNYLFFKP